MALLYLLILAVLFTLLTALVFSLLTLLLGLFWDDFEVTGPEGWNLQTFGEFYVRYLIVAVVYTLVTIPLGNGVIGIAALAVAYKYVFAAGWLQAAVMGIVGGSIACVLFLALLALLPG